MKRILMLAVTAALALASPAWSQPYRGEQGSRDLVRNWYSRFIGSEPNRTDLAAYSEQLRGDMKPQTVLLGILTSDDYYYGRAGGTDEGFVENLFIDLAGRSPTAEELGRYTDLASRDRHAPVSMLLSQFPDSWRTAPAATVERRDYDRPAPRVRVPGYRSYDRDRYERVRR